MTLGTPTPTNEKIVNDAIIILAYIYQHVEKENCPHCKRLLESYHEEEEVDLI